MAQVSEERRLELEGLIRHCESLAAGEDEAAAWEIKMGRFFVETYRNRAQMHRRTAESFRLEISTGLYHCVCCLKPG